MKRKTLTTAVMAGLTGVAGMMSVANAVNVNPDGLGQVLLYPYYSTRGGNDTLISVVNTTSDAKSVKIRFLEGLNSREVLDFNIYMSAFDVWSAAVTDLDSLDTEGLGGPGIIVRDTTCTVPYIFGFDNIPGGGAQPFLDFEFTGEKEDGGPTGIERAESGYIEIIEMGTLVDENEGDQAARNSATAATHTGGVPEDCQQLVDAWTLVAPGDTSYDPELDNYWVANPGDPALGRLTDHENPSGGLFGGASILSIAEGSLFSYNATAIDGFTADILHQDPGDTQPNLNSGSAFASNIFRNGEVVTDNWASVDNTAPVRAVSAVLMRDQLMNEYVVNENIGARSEWVVSFPTKRFYVDAEFGEFIGPDVDTPAQPFTELWGETPRAPGSPAGACEAVDFGLWDREELTPGEGPGPDPVPPIVSPPPPEDEPEPTPTFDLCFETNVVRFGPPGETADETAALAASEILQEPRFTTLKQFNEGWARLNFNSDTLVDPDDNPVVHQTEVLPAGNDSAGETYQGLPAIGFYVNTVSNNVVEEGVLRNFGGSFKHRGTRVIAPEIIRED